MKTSFFISDNCQLDKRNFQLNNEETNVNDGYWIINGKELTKFREESLVNEFGFNEEDEVLEIDEQIDCLLFLLADGFDDYIIKTENSNPPMSQDYQLKIIEILEKPLLRNTPDSPKVLSNNILSQNHNNSKFQEELDLSEIKNIESYSKIGKDENMSDILHSNDVSQIKKESPKNIHQKLRNTIGTPKKFVRVKRSSSVSKSELDFTNDISSDSQLKRFQDELNLRIKNFKEKARQISGHEIELSNNENEEEYEGIGPNSHSKEEIDSLYDMYSKEGENNPKVKENTTAPLYKPKVSPNTQYSNENGRSFFPFNINRLNSPANHQKNENLPKIGFNKQKTSEVARKDRIQEKIRANNEILSHIKQSHAIPSTKTKAQRIESVEKKNSFSIKNRSLTTYRGMNVMRTKEGTELSREKRLDILKQKLHIKGNVNEKMMKVLKAYNADVPLRQAIKKNNKSTY